MWQSLRSLPFHLYMPQWNTEQPNNVFFVRISISHRSPSHQGKLLEKLHRPMVLEILPLIIAYKSYKVFGTSKLR